MDTGSRNRCISQTNVKERESQLFGLKSLDGQVKWTIKESQFGQRSG